jgi:hypothetical protein
LLVDPWSRSKVLLVGRNVLADGRGRWLAIVALVVVSAAMLYAQNADAHRSGKTSASAASSVQSPAASAPAATPAAELVAASAPVAAQDIELALPPGVAPENGLQVKTIWAARAIGVMFPEIKTIGGYRQDALKWHPNGLAIDVMIPNHDSEEGIALGNQIAGFALANAQRWGVLHVIWRQGFYPGIGAPSWTADYGNETANHMDHVHISTDGGGYPVGNETYYIGYMDPAPPN